VTKGAGSRTKGLLMAYKLLDMTQARWRRLDGAHLLPLVRAGIAFVDGVQQEAKVSKPKAIDAAAISLPTRSCPDPSPKPDRCPTSSAIEPRLAGSGQVWPETGRKRATRRVGTCLLFHGSRRFPDVSRL
jgi:hypothetical protein